MAIETVPVAAAPVGLSPECSKLASDALFEITNLSILMRDYIAKTDELGMIEPVTRGMLARVQQLSEVVDECIARDQDSTPAADLAETVVCRRQAGLSTSTPSAGDEPDVADKQATPPVHDDSAGTLQSDLLQQAGELACLLRMSRDLAVAANDEGDRGAAWRLQSLLGATLQAANALHDAMGAIGDAA